MLEVSKIWSATNILLYTDLIWETGKYYTNTLKLTSPEPHGGEGRDKAKNLM